MNLRTGIVIQGKEQGSISLSKCEARLPGEYPNQQLVSRPLTSSPAQLNLALRSARALAKDRNLASLRRAWVRKVDSFT
jgi:hypothetical protein